MNSYLLPLTNPINHISPEFTCTVRLVTEQLDLVMLWIFPSISLICKVDENDSVTDFQKGSRNNAALHMLTQEVLSQQITFSCCWNICSFVGNFSCRMQWLPEVFIRSFFYALQRFLDERQWDHSQYQLEFQIHVRYEQKLFSTSNSSNCLWSGEH